MKKFQNISALHYVKLPEICKDRYPGVYGIKNSHKI